MKIHTKRFTSSKSTVARILNKRCAEERYREDQVKARNKIAPPANVPEMLKFEPLLTRIVNKVSAWVAVCPLDQVQASRGAAGFTQNLV